MPSVASPALAWAEAYEVASEIDADKRFGPFAQGRVRLVLFGLVAALILFVLEGLFVHPPLKWAWLPLPPLVLVLVRLAVPHRGRPFNYWLRVWPRHWTLPSVMDGQVLQRVIVRATTDELVLEDEEEQESVGDSHVGIVRSGTGEPLRAVIEVEGTTNPRLADDESIGTQIQRLAMWLNSVVPQMQIVVRTRPLDLSREITRLRQTGDTGDADLAAFLQRWVKGRPDKRWYVGVAGRNDAELKRNVSAIMEGLRRARLKGRWINGDLKVTLNACMAAKNEKAEQIGPSRLTRTATHILADGQYARTLLLKRMPSTVEPNWLKDVIDSNLFVDVVLWTDPLERAEQIAELDSRIGSWQTAQNLHYMKKGYLAADLVDQIRDAEGVKRALRRHQTRMFRVTVAFVIRAGSLAELDALENEVVRMVAEHVGQEPTLPADCEQELGYRLAVPLGEAELTLPIRVQTPSLARSNPFTDSGLVMRGKIRIPLGTSHESGRPVLYSPFVFANPHELVFGTSGAGKGFLLKVKLNRWLRLDPWATAIIIDQDPDHEYTPLAEDLGGHVWRITSSDQLEYVGPCEAEPAGTLRLAPKPKPTEPRAGYAGIPLEQWLAMPEWERNDAVRHAMDGLVREGTPSPWLGIPGELPARYRPRIVVYDLSGMPEKDRAATILAIMRGVQQLARLHKRDVVSEVSARPDSWRHRRDAEHALHIGHPEACTWIEEEPDQYRWVLLLDELWSLLDPEAPQECGPALENLWRTGRHDHVQAIGVTQRPMDVLGSKRGQVLARISLTKTYMRQTDEEVTDFARRARLTPKEQDFIVGADQGEYVIVADHKRVAASLRDQVSRREFAMART